MSLILHLLFMDTDAETKSRLDDDEQNGSFSISCTR